MVTILIMSARNAFLGLLKIKIFWNKDYDVIISVFDVTNEILSRDLNYILDVVLWPEFGNSSIPMTKVVITSILMRVWPEKFFFEERSWFKFNNLD